MCDCIDGVNEALDNNGANAQLSIVLVQDRESGEMKARVWIGQQPLVEKKRWKESRIIPHFCPFCGERHEPEVVA